MSKRRLLGVLISIACIMLISVSCSSCGPTNTEETEGTGGGDGTTGTIGVASSPSGASFAITGTASYSSTAPWSTSSALVGSYTITWGALSGYTAPSSETKSLSSSSSISFVGNYVQIGPPVSVEVRLDYFGIRWNHQDPTDSVPWKTQLYAVVDDGKTTMTFRYPNDDEGITMDSFHVEDLGGQSLFHTSSVGDHLKISVLACSSEDKEAKLAIWSTLETWNPDAGTMKQFYESLPLQSARVGYWEKYWSSTEKWGTDPGRYDGVGNDDLQVWLRIWSDKEPDAVAKPTVTPKVTIDDVVLCISNPKVRSKSECYQVTLWGDAIKLKNNESCPVTVQWERSSSNNRTGTVWVDKASPGYGDVTIPAGFVSTIVPWFWYASAGADNVTYTISYKTTQLDSWSGPMSILPAQDGSVSWVGC